MFLTSPKKRYLAVALALLAAVSMWFYVRKILIPYQVMDAALVGRPRGLLSDLYPRWLGARELLLHGRDPYSPEVTRDIQRGVYGRELDSLRANDPRDEQAFAYPVYVVFLLAPTVTMDFEVLRPIASALLVAFVCLAILLWNVVLATKLSRTGLLVTLILTLGSFPVVQGIRLQQLTIVVAGLLAAAFWARQSGRLLLSGVFMAIATIKPQIALLPVVALILWSLYDWKSRQRWFWGFLGTISALLAASEYVLPGWLPEFFRALRDYRRYTGGQSLLQAFLTPGVGRALGYLLLAYVVWVSWKARGSAPDSPQSRHLLCLLLVAAVCAMPSFATYNQIFLLPALLVLAQQNLLSSSRILARSFAWIAAVLLIWPWLVCVVLLPASIFLPFGSYARVWQIPLYGTLQLPLAVLALLLAGMAGTGAGKSLASVPRGVSCSL